MKFSVILLLIKFMTLCVFASNAVQSQWTGMEWPSMRDRWFSIGDDFRRRADSMRDWMLERQRTGISSLGPHRQSSESLSDKNQAFDPSVVVVDKGQDVDIPNPFPDLGFGFPFHVGIERPNFWSFISNQRPWWKGPNICIERKVIEGKESSNNTNNERLEVEEENIRINLNYQSFPHFTQAFSFQTTHCTESDTSYTCVSKMLRGRENRTTIVKHQCCHGFRRDPMSGCTRVDLKDLIQTMKDLKSNRMLKLTERLGFIKRLSEENVTVFALTDDSLIEYEDENNKIENEVETDTNSVPIPVRKRREVEKYMSDTIGMHLIPGLLKTGDFIDESLLSSMSPTKQMVRINVYNNPKRVVTANCAPIVSDNNYATNGIVHIIDRVMQRPVKTIAQLVESDPRFTILKNLLIKTDLMDKLKAEGKHMTLFAPTNDAFERLDKNYLQSLLKGQSCVGELLNHHIMSNTLCSTAIQGYASVKTGINSFASIKRSEDKLEINGIPVIETDKLGTNGVIHVIDGVMMSERSQPLSKYLQSHGMKEYLNLIKDSGLLEEWDVLQNVSFFIPSVPSMKTISDKNMEKIKNQTKDMISYHVVRHQNSSFDGYSDQLLQTIDGNLMRINIFGDILGLDFKPPVITAQCSKIVSPTEQICGANVYIVNRFLKPSKESLSQILDSNESFSYIRQILKNSGLEAELANGTHTLLAPNDQTILNHFSEKGVISLINNRLESQQFIRNHLFPEIICCSGVNNSPLFLSSQQFRNTEGSLVSVHKSLNGRIRFGNARVSQCDLMANNGVIHVIDRVLDIRPPMISSLPFPFTFK